MFTILAAQQITKSFFLPGGCIPVLDGVSFSVQDQSFVSIVGPSGCGKTTLMKILAGIMPYDSGKISLGNQLSEKHSEVAYMPQSDTLLPWRTAIGNALLPSQIEGVPRAAAIREIKDLFDHFGLSGFEKLYPVEMSGGMKQRLALMRTFLSHRDIILLDEPLGALDALTRTHLQEWLENIWQALGKTILLVTHDVEEALLLSDRIILFSARPARVRVELKMQIPRPRSCSDPSLIKEKEKLLRLIYAEERNGRDI
jgi:ABC-type nitrate/sulfonate/bicarbonate transport system ATPase subunit